MLSLIVVALAPAPAPPPAPATDAEYRAAVAQERAEQAQQPKLKKERPPINWMNRGGGYIIAGFGGEAFPSESIFRYSFEGGAIMGAGLPSATVGPRFTHLVGPSMYNLSVPIRLGVAGDQVGVYGIFEPGITVFNDGSEVAGRWRTAGGLSTFIVAWRGITLGADATWAILNDVESEEDIYGTVTTSKQHITSFAFVAFLGWKFGA